MSPQQDRVFAALADPTRRAILARLAAGTATVTELAAPFAISQPAVSKHLAVLERAGLVVRDGRGPRRPCRIRVDGLTPVLDWLGGMRRATAAPPSALTFRPGGGRGGGQDGPTT
ncbi:MAG: metalloregulator ArsR/SmtB family transcription factor [Azospirillaceae bacterium]